MTRTNAKGMPFKGRCMRCGMEDLPAEAVSWPCENIKGLSNADALIRAIHGVTTHA